MKKFLSMLAGAAALVAVSAHSANAQSRVVIGPFDLGDSRIFVAGLIAGGAMTGTYFAIDRFRGLKVPGDGKNWSTGAYTLTTVGCMALAPMLASAIVWHTEQRFLTNREAIGLGAGCVVPIIGPLVVDSSFRANPDWER